MHSDVFTYVTGVISRVDQGVAFRPTLAECHRHSREVETKHKRCEQRQRSHGVRIDAIQATNIIAMV